MSTIAFLSFGCFVVASLVIGARLLVAGMRSGRTPEITVGTAFFAGGLGYALLIIAFASTTFSLGTVPVVILLASTMMKAAVISLVCGIWNIFHPVARWPLIPIGVICALLAVSLGLNVRHVAEVPAPSSVYWTFVIPSAMAYAWSAIESIRFYVMMRRRVRIGLAEPEIARRFLLWGIAGTAGVGIHLCAVVNQVLDPLVLVPVVLLIQGLFGLCAAIGMWFAFFPPRRPRWLRASA